MEEKQKMSASMSEDEISLINRDLKGDETSSYKDESKNNPSNSDTCSECNKKSDDGYKAFLMPAISFALLLSGMIIDHFHDHIFNSTTWVKPLWYFIAFIPVGFPVIKEAVESFLKKDYFNELTLMSIACIGAFLIGEYSEAVGVMLFYSIGETLQNMAVDKATRDISKLLDVRTAIARVIIDGQMVIKAPEEVKPGEEIEVRAGERVPLDGELISSEGLFDTAALTGESVPRTLEKGDEVLAGMISTSYPVQIRVTKVYHDSAIARILDLVKNAQNRKAHSEVFIRKFARIYTPIVTLLAFLVVCIPAIVSLFAPTFHYVFSEWLYRALVFLVISCPCALVISVPLSYFAGIGAASREGILFKGGNYLETITNVNTVAFDKTGTLTTGEFSVETVKTYGITEDELLAIMGAGESKSSHPLAAAIMRYITIRKVKFHECVDIKEIPGKGTVTEIENNTILCGNLKLMNDYGVVYPESLNSDSSTIIACATKNKFLGYVTLSDTIKQDAKETITGLHEIGIDRAIMLSGDRKEIVKRYASEIGLKHYYGELLPEDKASIVEKIAKTKDKVIAFVGDGMNDAPVLALSNIGVAMGGLGSDVAIESADVVIQTDKPSKIVTAIKIGKYTKLIVTQNIIGAIVIKVVILGLGLAGIATLWAAVFADVGVTMLAVLNSMRIMWKKF